VLVLACLSTSREQGLGLITPLLSVFKMQFHCVFNCHPLFTDCNMWLVGVTKVVLEDVICAHHS
jgi:hypothetical protein